MVTLLSVLAGRVNHDDRSSPRTGPAPLPCDNILRTIERVGAGGARMNAAVARAGLEDIYGKVLEGARLSGDDGLRLYACADINVLGYLANITRERRNGDICYF